MLTRRKFIIHSCGLGVAGATIGTTLLSLAQARQIASADDGGYRALVCVMLGGGNDSYNMLVPYDSEQYAVYRKLRSDLALDHGSLLPLPPDPLGRTYGLHPGMSEVHDLYLTGDLAFLNNVGTLLEPIDPVALENGVARVPLGLYSHSDQQMQWQTGVSSSRSTSEGWLGRTADIQGPNLANGIARNISLGGTNVLQSGSVAVPYSISGHDDGAPGVFGYDNNPYIRDRIDDLFAPDHDNLIRSEYARRMRRAIENQGTFVDAIQQSPSIETEFAEDYFSQALRQIARVIGARDAFGANRQTFYAVFGGWDHHDEVLENQAGMLPVVSKGLKSFHDALLELGVLDNVTTFTVSDFGRTLTSNGKGSDHGWGGHHLIMGGAVNGGKMYGVYPTLAENSPMDTGRGVYFPTTSTDEYFADLALWYGVSPDDLDLVLPNIREFHSPGSGEAPLGMMT